MSKATGSAAPVSDEVQEFVDSVLSTGPLPALCVFDLDFLKITKATGIAFKDMIFLDDEYGNIEDMEGHGVVSQHVPRTGATLEALGELVKRWRKARQK